MTAFIPATIRGIPRPPRQATVPALDRTRVRRDGRAHAAIVGNVKITPVQLDGAAALALAAVAIAGFHELAQMEAVPRPVAVVLVLLSVLPAAARRPWPRAALAVVTVASAAVLALYRGDPPPQFAVAFVVYLVPARFPLRDALGLLGGTLAALAAAACTLPGRTAVDALAVNGLLVAGTWAVGYAVAQQRAYARAVRSQAEREDRIRIARELHDVVAHGLSLIAVQAGVAGWVAESQPAEAARALASIEEISRGALREMRALLGVLRVADGPAPADLEPAHGLADLPALADRVTTAGVAVTLDVRGAPRPLLPGVDLGAYRVAQEALTNVIKHSGATRCQVSVRYEPRAVELEITDDGGGTTPGGASGHGITGMRERVAMYDGTFLAGPRPEGGFTVTARFPA
jgi:signal transduction histidine kinase